MRSSRPFPREAETWRGKTCEVMTGSLNRCEAQSARGGSRTRFFFAGPEGIGKLAFARKLAQALLCETRPEEELDPCGQCPGCLQVEAGTHPDFHEAGKPEDKHELPISVIRELCDQFALEAGPRIAQGGDPG